MLRLSFKKLFKKTTEWTAQKSVLFPMNYKSNIYIFKKKEVKMKSYLQTVTFATIKNNGNCWRRHQLSLCSKKAFPVYEKKIIMYSRTLFPVNAFQISEKVVYHTSSCWISLDLCIICVLCWCSSARLPIRRNHISSHKKMESVQSNMQDTLSATLEDA